MYSKYYKSKKTKTTYILERRGSNTQFMTPTGRLGISPAGHRGTLPMFTFGATVPAGSAVFRNGHG